MILRPILIAALLAAGCAPTEPVGTCGDDLCEEAVESCSTCAADCGECASHCGDGTCDDGIEDCTSCAGDCGACDATCGDAACDDAIESCEACAADCGACPLECGDSLCSAGLETCATCAEDCGACGSTCGDDTCDTALENCESCNQDCGACDPYCGDGTCDPGLEVCDACAKDCGICQDPPVTTLKDLKVMSWNVHHAIARAHFADALDAFESAGLDVVGFQELSGDGKLDYLKAKTNCSTCFFGSWSPGTGSGTGGNVSIMWKKSRFRVVLDGDGQPMRGAFRVHGAESVEDGAGGSTTTPKYIAYVRLRDTVTNQLFWAMNAHALPTVEASCGHPNSKIKRLTLYKKMMDAFKTLISARTGPIFITGDYNVNYRCDSQVQHYRFPFKSFNSLNPRVKSNWEWHERAGKTLPAMGTHKPHEGGRRLIDYVFARSSPDVSYKSTAIWADRRFGSDHAPVLSTYSLRQK